MADIMKEDRYLGGLKLGIGYFYALVPKVIKNTAHQMHCPQSMLKAGVNSARVNEVCQAQLPDPAQPLKPRMSYYIENYFTSDCNEAVYGIIDDLFFIHPC